MNTTEASSYYDDLEKMSVSDILININKEDQTVPLTVAKTIPRIETLVKKIVEKMKLGGRLFYIGAGTSGRLGILDASECPPTFGVPQGLVIGLIAGGDEAIRKAVENAEDDHEQGWRDLQAFDITKKDVVVGIAASGGTPYVIGAVKRARKMGLITGCITCNTGSKLSETVEFPIEVVVGPEFVTGSTRMKSGTAQKFVLNMITTATMIKLGKIKGNKMVDMELTNDKLVERGTLMIMQELNIEYAKAKKLLLTHGSVRRAIEASNQ